MSFLTGARAARAIPYDMFDAERSDVEAEQAGRLERIYHKGQDAAWDGKAVLAELVARHGGVRLAPERAEAVRNLFAIIFWGELAAWKVSAELAQRLEPLEAKLAATSQAHDESRHFYVMRDYLALVGYRPAELPPLTTRALDEVLRAPTLVQKLIGMHLMVEPIALSVFQIVRERQLEPVLCDLLVYFERDEARHVAIGVQQLPALVAGMRKRDVVRTLAWMLKMFELQLAGLDEYQSSFAALGIGMNEAVWLGMNKQRHAFDTMIAELGRDPDEVAWVRRYYEWRVDRKWPPGVG